MGKYKKLVTNTFVFGIASFSSKLLPFLFLPIYISVLSDDVYGNANLIVDICNFILPIMYLSISEAIIRFGMDKAVRKQDVYTTGILVLLGGYLVLWALYPLLTMYELIGQYSGIIYAYIFASAFRTITTHFVRARGYVRLFAIDGIFTTVTTAGFNLLFILVFKAGVVSIAMATLCGDLLSAVLLTIITKSWRYFSLRDYNTGIAKAMLRYSIPLVPNGVFWWVINLSDRFFIKEMIGDGAVGVYTFASKIPNLLTIVSAIFIQAWQMSAFSDFKQGDRERTSFFSTIFKSYYTLLFLAVSVIVLLVRPIIGLMTSAESAVAYANAWRLVPFLLLSTAFSCLVTFLGTIYNTVKKNTMVVLTTMLGAVINLVLNYLLIRIPSLGSMGAAIATMISYFVVLIVRLVDTRRYIPINADAGRITASVALLLGQILICLFQPPLGVLWQVLIFAALLACNFKYLIFLVRKAMGFLYQMLHKRRA